MIKMTACSYDFPAMASGTPLNFGRQPTMPVGVEMQGLVQVYVKLARLQMPGERESVLQPLQLQRDLMVD